MQHKWKQLGDLALARSEVDLAAQCCRASRDVGGLLLICSATGDAQGMVDVATLAREDGLYNVAFLALFLLGRVEACLDVLVEAGRIPEVNYDCLLFGF